MNIKGLLNKTDKLRELYSDKYCDFIFVQEISITSDQVGAVLGKLGLGSKHAFFSFSSRKFNGTAIFQVSNRWDVVSSHSDVYGRVTGINIKNGTDFFSLVNIYAPSGESSEKRADKGEFFVNLHYWIRTHMKHKLIIGGDFNVTLEEIDQRGHKSKTRAGRQELQKLVTTYALIDTYRHKYPTGSAVTHESTRNTAARLDRIYTHTSIHIQHIEHLPQTTKFTDHKGVYTTLGTLEMSHSKSTHWKLNDSLLEHQPFINFVRDLLNTHYTAFTEVENKIEIYESLKLIIKQQAQQVGRELNKDRKFEIKYYEELIAVTKGNNQGELTETDQKNIKIWEENIQKIHTHTYRGAQIRSKLVKIEDETPNAAFLGLESGIQGGREIREIKTLTGALTTDPSEITTTFRDYYEDLFDLEETDPNVQEHFLNFSRSISDSARQNNDLDISDSDLETAINNLNTDSSPGPDGMTSRFYLFFLKS